MRILTLPLVLMPLAAPLPAAAQDQIDLPDGCTAYLTVQSKSCRVSHHFTCEMDPDGWQRRIDMDQNGISYLGAIDDETRWMESFHMYSGHSERLVEGAENPASFTELLESGVNTYEFETDSDEVGVSRYVGEDRLTGETVDIDGVTLDRTQYAITAYDADGNVTWSSTGTEYINRDWRMFLSGQSTYMSDGESFDSDDAPVEFIFPDEAGFLSPNPKFGCNEESA
ncbi:hypothetical protein [Wenxinia marina]|nr:hypothetical protein [Wenxinia marina]GGL55867.1 hypothetical protein GCM10011392_07880 [Wenxinia marina]